MPEEQRSGLRVRDASPDSVIFTLESNFSLFSSASASVDRCSFDSEISPHSSSAAHEESSSGPDRDPDPNKLALHSNIITHGRLSRKGEKAKVQKYDTDADIGLIDSARNSFSLALKECQDRRSRSEALSKKLDRPRPASLDLNNASVSSPRLGTIKKTSMASSRKSSGTFPSPGTPTYRHTALGVHKGWSSERVPAHSNMGRKNNTTAALLPFNNGRTLPSKWEDAERWIFSPVQGGDGVVRNSYQQAQRRPKSKSGPLGPPGVAYYSLYSPAMPMFEGGNVGNFMPASPFSAGVIAADGLAFHSGDNNGGFPIRTEPCIARSASVHGCSEVLNQQPSLPCSQDEKLDGVKDAATNVSRAVSRRDMATQMSPDESTHSSPNGGPSYSASTSSIMPVLELQSGAPSMKLEVRDVQVDERVTVTRWSKKHRSRIPGTGSDIVDNWKKKDAEARSSAWDLSDTAAKNMSQVKREEAKITAWENLQKAKAEAAIRKLEMKLEKKRSSSMDKIMSKLRSAQKKAKDMRSSVSTNQAQGSRTSRKAISIRRTRQMGSLSGCFTCHAF